MAPSLNGRAWIRQSLPQEHGSWSFVLEPLLIAAVLNISRFGWVSLGTFLMFLGFRPMQIGLKDLLKRKSYPRTAPSVVAGLLLCGTGVICLVWSRNWVASAWVIGMGSLFVLTSRLTSPRSLIREIVGVMVAVPVAILAAPLAAEVLVLRPIASVLGVRGVLGRWADHVMSRWLAVGAGAAMVLFAVGAFPIDNSKFVAYSLCGVRALELALTPTYPRKPSTVGMVEAVLALAVVAAWSAQGY